MIDGEYYRPTTAQELGELLQRTEGTVIAGCTDILPHARRGNFSAECLVDISRLGELHYIREANYQIQIGPLSTHADIAASSLLQDVAPALVRAAISVGCPQTRNRGTLGGNLANASPAADSAPPLLALDASVRLVCTQAERTMPLADFFHGPGRTALDRGEYLEGVFFERPTGAWGASFLKLGKRSGMAISIVSVAAFLVVDSVGKLATVRVSLGSVAPTPIRSQHVENALTATVPSADSLRAASQLAERDISPIDDLRATASYRKHAAVVMVYRALQEAWEQAKGRCS